MSTEDKSLSDFIEKEDLIKTKENFRNKETNLSNQWFEESII